MAANTAAKDYKTRLKTGYATIENPMLMRVSMERKMMQAGYTFADIKNMDFTEFMVRYMIIKELIKEG